MWVKPVFFLSEKRNMKREGGTTRGLSLIFRLVAFSGPLVPPIFLFCHFFFLSFPEHYLFHLVGISSGAALVAAASVATLTTSLEVGKAMDRLRWPFNFDMFPTTMFHL